MPLTGRHTVDEDLEITLSRHQLLAAEVFCYSYANYHDHLGVNIRFDDLMPEIVATLEQAEQEGWSIEKTAERLERETDEVSEMLEALQEAREVVDAKHPAESFRNGVRQSIQMALEDGLETPEKIERLVGQICYRAADLAYLLDREGEVLSEYSEYFRWEPEEGYPDDEE
jgi:hypothetical protein